MKPSLHTTTYCFPEVMPRYAVRRISDGYFLDSSKGFRPMGGQTGGKHWTCRRNDAHIDFRTSADAWAGQDLPGCEVVAIAEVVTITAVPVDW